MQKCRLKLSTGLELEGRLIGAPLKASGEMVFTTGMVGYSEALTDPSYFGQILVFSYPLIGNYGIPKLPEDLEIPIPRGFESAKVNAAAVILTVDSQSAFHWNSFESLDTWLKRVGVPGIAGIDTRHLVHLIRNTPQLMGQILPDKPEGYRDYGTISEEHHQEKFFDPGLHEVLTEVSSPRPRRLGKGSKRIGLIDCGVKWNIIRQLLSLDCEVELVPWNTPLEDVDCGGWLISNGPGNPQNTGDLVPRVAKLLQEDRPVLGICLGHQILALAAGASTQRMTYGHRSHNQPVNLVGTRRGFITSQNHGYVVVDESLPELWEPWFRNVNDSTIEGIRHVKMPFRSVQFHPEAAGGPRDTSWIMRDFIGEVRG